ncbi:polygalacturonase, partial [Phytophthora sojae]
MSDYRESGAKKTGRRHLLHAVVTHDSAFFTTFAALAFLASAVNGVTMLRQAEQGSSTSSSCTLSGTYKSGTDISSCSSVTIGSSTARGQSITRPVFFRLHGVSDSVLSGFTLKNSPYRTFSIVNCESTAISGLTLDSRAGNGIAKNTDGFDLTNNDHVTITGNKIYNQDDCLAMQSSTNTVFSNNYCCGGTASPSARSEATPWTSRQQGNTIEDSDNGIRIKTIIGMKGLVSDVKYSNNKLSNVKNAIVMHSDYSKSKGGYTGSPTSAVTIEGVTISGLKGSATNL